MVSGDCVFLPRGLGLHRYEETQALTHHVGCYHDGDAGDAVRDADHTHAILHGGVAPCKQAFEDLEELGFDRAFGSHPRSQPS